MPGKAWTGATAQMASSRCFIGLQETRHMASRTESARVQAGCPLLGIHPRHILVYISIRRYVGLFGVANTGDNLIVPWKEHASSHSVIRRAAVQVGK